MIIARNDWQAQRAAYQEQVQVWTTPRLERRSRQQKHPVDDFMWEYYPISASKLMAWHPGLGRSLEATQDDIENFSAKIYEFQNGHIAVSDTYLEKQRERITWIYDFLGKTATRESSFGCFGLHEWAMVMGIDDVRHNAWPLRLPQEKIAEVINDIGLRCTHYDAFRFFTDDSRPLNPLQLVRANQIDVEQPACLHANMDLYKWSFELAPFIGSDTVITAFTLARDIRTTDMQAAPYDLLDLGVAPIFLETPEGRAQFVVAQKQFSARAQQLRETIRTAIEELGLAPQPVN